MVPCDSVGAPPLFNMRVSMKLSKSLVGLFVVFVLVALASGPAAVRAANGIVLKPILSCPSPSPCIVDGGVGIDWLPTGTYGDQLLVSANYRAGFPLNFAHVN